MKSKLQNCCILSVQSHFPFSFLALEIFFLPFALYVAVIMYMSLMWHI